MDKRLNNKLWAWIVGWIITAIALWAQATVSLPTMGTDATSQARLVETYGKLPLSFEVNQGQTGKPVRFLSRGPGYSVFLTPTEAVLALRKSDHELKNKPPLPPGERNGVRERGIEQPVQTSTLRLQLVGVNPKAKISGVDILGGIPTVTTLSAAC